MKEVVSAVGNMSNLNFCLFPKVILAYQFWCPIILVKHNFLIGGIFKMFHADLFLIISFFKYLENL